MDVVGLCKRWRLTAKKIGVDLRLLKLIEKLHCIAYN